MAAQIPTETQPNHSMRVAATAENGDWVAEFRKGDKVTEYVLVSPLSGPLDASRLAQK